MPDREIVVKWFEFCRVEDKCSTDCPYFDNTGSARECTKKLAKDVLTLLKEQEAVEPKITTLPKKDHDDSHIYRCGNCDMIIFKSHKYCPFCGKAVKWNA